MALVHEPCPYRKHVLKTRYTLALSCLLAAGATWAHAGEFAWYFDNNTSTFTDNQLSQLISNGFENAPGSTPSLDKKFKIGIFVGGGPDKTNATAPAFIHMQKGKPAKEGGLIIKCDKYWVGNVDRKALALAVQTQVTEMAKFVSSKECQ